MYVINEQISHIGQVIEDNRPRFKTKKEAVAELRAYIREDKAEYKDHYNFGGCLKVSGNLWKETIRLTFGCNLYAAYYISETY